MANEIFTKKYMGLMKQFGPEMALTVLIRETNAYGGMEEWQTKKTDGDVLHFAQIEGFMAQVETKHGKKRNSVAGYGSTREGAMQSLLEGLLFPEKTAPQHYQMSLTLKSYLYVMQPSGECKKFEVKNGAERPSARYAPQDLKLAFN